MYKYIFWDLDETLLDFKLAEATAIAQVLKIVGIEPIKENIELYSKINHSCWKQYEKGEIKREDIYKNRVILLGEQLGVDIDVSKFSTEYFTRLSRQGQTFPFALRILKYLKEKGYNMAAATNGAAPIQVYRIINSGLSGFFNKGIFISEKIGYKKPEPEFFYYMMNTLGIKNKNEVLVIGDSQSSDIKGALSAGLDCCFVNLKGEDLIENLKPTYIATSLEEIINVCKL
jgi:YjjG family noncanonical pyrimidine nucleotidase